MTSIRRLAHGGCVASFWKGCGKTEFASGVVMSIFERWGVYVAELDVLSPPEKQNTGFTWPEP